ncbi:hypothetical protein F383_36427 [Gossypium arboreum]|uniref:Uncharacterized protein n=1 Tax=Gossypium arboreum TaxID=29729 RepID=A0A0B0Q183_GOSAR|nr:hypothetical protein F383_18942 [Gossypium arboreum]KHG30584.1 hypothetical protein F383_36427 [Gossypium arboreum]
MNILVTNMFDLMHVIRQFSQMDGNITLYA